MFHPRARPAPQVQSSRCASSPARAASGAFASFAAFAALTALSCSGLPPPRYPIREANGIVASLQRRETRVQSLRATGAVDHFGRQGRVHGSVTIFVRRPDLIHVDVFAFGHLVQSLVANRERFSLLQGQNYLTGPSRPCVAQQLLGMPLTSQDFTSILTGGAPMLGTQMTAPRWENGRYVVDVQGTDGASERIEFDLADAQRQSTPEQQDVRVRRVVLRDRQGLRGEITYDSYRMVQGLPFPDRVRIVMPRDHVDSQLRFDEIVPNFTIPPDPDDPDAPAIDPFRQSPPAGAEVSTIDC